MGLAGAAAEEGQSESARGAAEHQACTEAVRGRVILMTRSMGSVIVVSTILRAQNKDTGHIRFYTRRTKQHRILSARNPRDCRRYNNINIIIHSSQIVCFPNDGDQVAYTGSRGGRE